MSNRRPLGVKNDNSAIFRDEFASPQKRLTLNIDPHGRTFSENSVDSGFVSPETICPPKLTNRRRSSPFSLSQPLSSFRFEDSSESLQVSENAPTSKAFADLWTKPLKTSSVELSTKSNYQLCSDSEGSNTPNRRSDEFPPTKLSFDSCESSGDDKSPPAPLPVSRKGLGFRRALSYAEPERNKQTFPPSCEGTPVFQPKRHKFEDDTSPYKLYSDLPLVDLFAGPCSQPEPSTSTSIDLFTRCFSQPEPPISKQVPSQTTSLTPEVKRLTFQRSQSESALGSSSSCSIKRGLERLESNPCLIGDGSKSYILPFKDNGKHQDLKEITGVTLSSLLQGKMDESIKSFKIIDCRYPYEFEGGHIQGAINLFTRKQVYDELISPKLGSQVNITESREIYIFHCEFSSQRGPDMCRFLRDTDRESNGTSYPNLYYPELYVLFGGYKQFFQEFPNLCEPRTYLPMDDPQHADSFRRYKSKTKLDIPDCHQNSRKKGKSQKFGRAASFAKKCNF